MVENYFKIAWRNLKKDKQFTILNLLGLSTGLACVLLIYLWVHDELMVDKFNEKDSRLYQVIKTAPSSDGTIATYETTQGLLAQEMAISYPEIEYAVPVRKEGDLGILSVNKKNIKASWEFAGGNFFDVFSYQLLEGSKNNVFANKYGVLLSEQTALKLFNTTKNLIGTTFTWDGGGEFNGTYSIAGVFKNPPTNATDQFDLVFNYSLYAEKEIGGQGDISNWASNSVLTYLILKEGTGISTFNKKIKDFTRAKIQSLKGSGDLVKYEGDIFVQKYSDKYLHNHYENGKIAGGRIQYVTLFSVIAIFLLAIACINFMNLSTAKAAGRIKEVGIRKVIGAQRKALIAQYMGESLLMSFLSIVIALFIASLLLPAFKSITGKELSISFGPGFLFTITGIALITGIFAGSYPAIYLSGFKPAMVLKGEFSGTTGETFIRKGLVVFQFTISVVLIISVLTVYAQMQLIQTKNLGYNKDNIIHFSAEGKLKKNLTTFLSEVKKMPGVVNVSAMNGDLVGHTAHSGSGIDWEGKDPNTGIEYYGVSGDYGFMETLGLQMKEGRSFSPQFGSDSLSVIFNEAAINAMGIKNPIGKTVSLWGKNKQIIGIVKDFHFESLYKKVGPAFLEYSTDNETVLIKIKAGAENKTIAALDNFYKQFNLGLPFEYRFLDNDYQAMYASEQKVVVLSRYFVTIAIIVSCLGLFGLTAFTARKKQKEIGIRKVIGATVTSITFMLSKDFLKLVLVALLIGFPLSWWTMHQWLQGFAYRAPLSAATFMTAGVSIVTITIITISFQSIKAALMNPVKSLRTE